MGKKTKTPKNKVGIGEISVKISDNGIISWLKELKSQLTVEKSMKTLVTEI